MLGGYLLFMEIPINKLLYALLYATIVTFLTYSFTNKPTLLQMEYSLYDPIQRHLALEDRTNQRYQNNPAFNQHTSNVFCLNLNKDYFDTYSERIKRNRLAELLSYLNEYTEPKAVLVNFVFAKNEEHLTDPLVDSLLIKAIKSFKQPLIFPNGLSFQPITFQQELKASSSFQRYPLTYEMPTVGFATPILLTGDNRSRYWQYQTSDGQLPSLIKVLIDTLYSHDLHQKVKRIPDRFEINYWLKDRRPKEKMWILDDADATSLLQMNKEEVARKLKNKILFIGFFEDWTNQYDLPIDKFATPISTTTSSIFISLNAYLNVLGQTYLQKIGSWGVFWSNFIIALLGVWYYKVKQKSNSFFRKRLLEVLLSSVLFIGILGYLLTYHYLKFPFVFTLLFYIKNQFFYHFFEKCIVKFDSI